MSTPETPSTVEEFLTLTAPQAPPSKRSRAPKEKARGLGRIYQQKYKDKRTGAWRTTDTWYIEYWHRGQQYREKTGSTKRAVAERLLKRRIGDTSRGDVFLGPQAEKLTFNDLADMLLTEYRVDGKRSLRRAEQGLAHLRGFFDQALALDITTDRLRAYIAQRLSERPGNLKNPTSPKRTAPGTINRELAYLRHAFRLAVDANRFGRCPHFPMLREDNVRTGFFEREQYAALRAALPDSLRPAMDFAYETGWRIAEVLTLTWAQVDFTAGTVRLEPGRGRTKSGEGREFPFAALPALGALLRRQRDSVTALEREQARIIPWVFVHRTGTRAGAPIRSYTNAWKRACQRVGLSGKIPHDFRRTAARRMERAGLARSVSMKLIGHKTESMFRRYTIVSETDLREGVAKLAALSAAEAEAPRTFVSLAAASDHRREASR